jgi:hypothetical protein
MIVTPLPILSYILPKIGYNKIVPKGKIPGIMPAIDGSTLNLLTIKSLAYFRKGKTAE